MKKTLLFTIAFLAVCLSSVSCDTKKQSNSDNDYSWVIGEWRLQTSSWWVKITFNSDGSYYKKEGPMQGLGTYQEDSGLYYVYSDRIKLKKFDGRVSELDIKPGHIISNGRDDFRKYY